MTKVFRETKTDLHAFVSVCRQRLGLKGFVLRISQIGAIRERFHCNFRRLKLRETGRDVG